MLSFDFRLSMTSFYFSRKSTVLVNLHCFDEFLQLGSFLIFLDSFCIIRPWAIEFLSVDSVLVVALAICKTRMRKALFPCFSFCNHQKFLEAPNHSDNGVKLKTPFQTRQDFPPTITVGKQVMCSSEASRELRLFKSPKWSVLHNNSSTHN